jgi:Fe-S cluster assembly protein SufD
MNPVFNQLHNDLKALTPLAMDDGPSQNHWLPKYRAQGWSAFQARGLPDRTWEDWRYFSLRSIKEPKEAFSLGDAKSSTLKVDEESQKKFLKKILVDKGLLEFGDFERQVIMVSYNGHLWSLGVLYQGVSIKSLDSLSPEDYAIFEKNFVDQRHAGESFYHLNSAFLTHGIFISVAKAAEAAPRTIHVIHVITPSEKGPQATGTPGCRTFFPRLGFEVNEGAEVALVETYLGLGGPDSGETGSDGGEPSLTVPITQILLKAGSKLNHVRIQQDAPGGMHIGSTQKALMAGSILKTFSLSSHGPLIRHDLRIDLKDKDAFAQFDGLFLVKNSQLVDHHTTVDHRVPNTQSRQLYHGIISDHGRGIFNGKVLVRVGAHGTDARQTNKNLILSSDGEIDTKPELQIDADDVKCSHGAAVGQLDPEHLFYLQARGISESTARKMLLQAFAQDCLERFPVQSPTLSKWVNNQVLEYFAT